MKVGFSGVSVASSCGWKYDIELARVGHWFEAREEASFAAPWSSLLFSRTCIRTVALQLTNDRHQHHKPIGSSPFPCFDAFYNAIVAADLALGAHPDRDAPASPPDPSRLRPNNANTPRLVESPVSSDAKPY
jgi:hypothetical protein